MLPHAEFHNPKQRRCLAVDVFRRAIDSWFSISDSRRYLCIGQSIPMEQRVFAPIELKMLPKDATLHTNCKWETFEAVIVHIIENWLNDYSSSSSYDEHWNLPQKVCRLSGSACLFRPKIYRSLTHAHTQIDLRPVERCPATSAFILVSDYRFWNVLR